MPLHFNTEVILLHIVQDDEEDTSIFNMGMPLDAAGTEAMFNFGVSPNPGGSAGSTFTTHQQQQAEQELAEKRMSQMQVNDLSAPPQRATLGATDMVSCFMCAMPDCAMMIRVSCLIWLM